MAHSVEWYRESRIIFSTVGGNLEFDELIEWGNQIQQHLNGGHAPVHLLVDVSQMTRYPTNVLQIRNSLPFLGNPALGQVMLIGGSSSLNTLARVVTALSGKPLSGFRTMKTALDSLVQHDHSLSDLQVNE